MSDIERKREAQRLYLVGHDAYVDSMENMYRESPNRRELALLKAIAAMLTARRPGTP